MMELRDAVSICERDARDATAHNRKRRARIVEKSTPNGATLWLHEDGKPLVNLIWSSQDLLRPVTMKTGRSVMDRAGESK